MRSVHPQQGGRLDDHELGLEERPGDLFHLRDGKGCGIGPDSNSRRVGEGEARIGDGRAHLLGEHASGGVGECRGLDAAGQDAGRCGPIQVASRE